MKYEEISTNIGQDIFNIKNNNEKMACFENCVLKLPYLVNNNLPINKLVGYINIGE